MDLLVLVARILFVPLFLSSAMGHLMATDAMAGYAASKGIPRPVRSHASLTASRWTGSSVVRATIRTASAFGLGSMDQVMGPIGSSDLRSA
mgnify:CR=1 FL=1